MMRVAGSSRLPVASPQQQETEYLQTGSRPEQQPRGKHMSPLHYVGKGGLLEGGPGRPEQDAGKGKS